MVWFLSEQGLHGLNYMHTCIHTYIHAFIHSFTHVQSVENVGTRKKRKENMRKAIDVETKREKTLKTFDTTYIK